MSSEVRLLSLRAAALRALKESHARIEELHHMMEGPGNRPAAGLRREVKRANTALETAIIRVAAVPITQVEKRDAKKAKEARRS